MRTSPPPVRVTWRVLGSLLTLVVVVIGLLQVVGLLARSTSDVDIDVAADRVDELVVELASGSVEVRGTESDRIRVRGTITSGMVSTEHRESIVSDRLVLYSDCPPGPVSTFCSVEHVIEVPRDLAVTVRSTHTGVTLTQLSGSVDVSTSDSAITGSGLTGRTRLQTSNDSVEIDRLSSTVVEVRTSNDSVDLRFTEPPERVDVHTSNDSVGVIVPDTSATFAIDLDTSNGTRQSDIRTDPSSDRRIVVRTSNGDVVLRYPDT